LSRSLLPLIPAALQVMQILPAPDRITILTAPKPSGSACPLCGAVSSRVHSHYTRTLADLPWQGRAVTVQVRARRFRCGRAGCPRQVFAERLPDVAPSWARRTARLGGIQRHIGLALGGEPGARLAARLAMPVSGDTLLRLVRAAELPSQPPPRVVGIDEWAWRRGLSYGTIVCDLERGRVVDLLPDRRTETVAAWLKRHPSVAVIARDRASVFAEAVRQGAPQASQVADRWHLLRNLGDALRAAVDRHCVAVIAAASAVAEVANTDHRPPPAPEAAGTQLSALRRARRDSRAEHYAMVWRLHEAGMVPRLIAPRVGMSQRSVERWLRAGGEPEHRRPPVASLVDPFRPHLERRWQEGCRNVADLWREIRDQGFTGSLNTLRRWAEPHRRPHAPDPVAAVPRSAAPRALSRRRCAWLLGLEPEKLTLGEQAFIGRLTAAAPELAEAGVLARRFAAMIRARDGAGLDAWLTSARESELGLLAQGFARDLAAVRAAITERWSTSPVEGQISRLKAIKRQMFGRAGYELLRRRVLAAA